jgi:hypothetical protein
MESPERSDPTFTVFLVLAFVFLIVFMYVTFPRPDASGPAPKATAPEVKK